MNIAQPCPIIQTLSSFRNYPCRTITGQEVTYPSITKFTTLFSEHLIVHASVIYYPVNLVCHIYKLIYLFSRTKKLFHA